MISPVASSSTISLFICFSLIISLFPLAVFGQYVDSFDLALFSDSSCSQRLGNLSSVTSQSASLTSSGQCSSSPPSWINDGFPSYVAYCINATSGTMGNWRYVFSLTTCPDVNCPGFLGRPQGNFTLVQYSANSDPQSSRGNCVPMAGIILYPNSTSPQTFSIMSKQSNIRAMTHWERQRS